MLKIFILFCFFSQVVKAAVNECQTCIRMSQLIQVFQGESYDQVFQRANGSLRFYNTEDQQFLAIVLQYNFRKLYLDMDNPSPGMTPTATCADLGYCDFTVANFEWAPNFKINTRFDTFWDDHSEVKNTRDKTIIVLHDTETGSLQETIDALKDEGLSVTYIVDVDGQVYQYVRDFQRAWHAGSGIWRGDGCNVSDTNTRSVGIETVNSGDESFPPAQILGIYKLIDYLRTKWHVDPWNIIAHHENGPDYKYDISGYFSWKGLFDSLGLWKDLWTSKLTYEKQSMVLLNPSIKNDSLKTQIQQLLFNHGYGTVIVGDPYDTSSKSKVTTAMAIQSFNRKFCPEIFLLEKMRNGDQILDKRNQQMAVDWAAKRQKSKIHVFLGNPLTLETVGS